MHAKSGLSLSNILGDFKKSLEDPTEKTAEEAVSGVEPEEEKVVEAEEITETETETEVAGVDALKKIAQDAIDKEAEGMEKEAEAFGAIFANSFMEELEKTAQIKAITSDAYDATLASIKTAAFQDTLEEVGVEAYENTVAKLACDGAYRETQNFLTEKTAGEMPLIFAGITQEAYDDTLAILGQA